MYILDAARKMLLVCCYCCFVLFFPPKTRVSDDIEMNHTHLSLTVGSFWVLQGPLSADQPETLELDLRRSAQNILSPLAHVSAPLPKETEVEC